MAWRDTSVSTEVLVERAQRGDEWARAALYHRFARDLGNLALRLTRNRDDAADVLQDTFVVAFERLRSVQDPARIGGWLRTILVNRVQRRFRRARLFRLFGFATRDELPLEALASPDASQETLADLHRLGRALAGLDERARTVWTLRELEGETLPRIAELTGTSLATVKRDLARAAAHVERALGGHHD